MKHWIIAALFTLMVSVSADAANMALEPGINPSPGATIVTRGIKNHAGGTSFSITADAADSSWVMQLRNETSVTLTFASAGDSVNVQVKFYGGNTIPLSTDITKINYSTFSFVLQDSVTVTTAGAMSRKISTAMTNNPYFFFTVTGLEGNGNATTITGTATREVYPTLMPASVDSTKIKDGTVSNGDLRADAVTGAKIQASAIDSTDVKNGSLSGADLINDAITAAKIEEGVIDSTHVKDDSIGNEDLVANSVSTTEIRDGTIAGVDVSTTFSFGKTFGITAITAMSDTTGLTGIRLFTFTGDTLYVYKSDHTISVIK